MTVTEAEIKETAVQLANLVIATYSNEKLSGTQKEEKVIAFLADLDNQIPIAAFIPDALEEKVLEVGYDKLKEFYQDDIKGFVKKCYERIKHILHIG